MHSGSYAAGPIEPGLAACWFSPAERATRSDTGVPVASVGARAWRQGAWTARHLLVGTVRGRDGEKQPDGRTVDRRGGISPLAYRLDGRGREVTVAEGGDHPDVRNRAVPLDDAREDDPPFAGVPARLPAELGLHAVKLDGGRQARLHGRVPSIDDGIGGLGLVEGAQVVDQRDADLGRDRRGDPLSRASRETETAEDEGGEERAHGDSFGSRSWSAEAPASVRRKRVEEIFGWVKATAGKAKTRFRGKRRVTAELLATMTAYNLIRMARLEPAAA